MWHHTMCSMTLAVRDLSDTGLQFFGSALEPLLKMAQILASFQVVGRVLES